ncbi:hypothetical protein J3R82DRAFT_8690 [Butyriboletus roseoflavus]|nr:hypothetical protein J3R82DRAFT_8690 [Butyriboletus roseoflavus]
MAKKKEKITLPKILNKAAGNISKGTFMFSMANWGSKTQSYAISVTRKGSENTTNIITFVYALLNHGLTSSSPSDTDTVDPCAIF